MKLGKPIRKASLNYKETVLSLQTETDEDVFLICISHNCNRKELSLCNLCQKHVSIETLNCVNFFSSTLKHTKIN